MNEIELIKQKIDIVEFIGNYLELKKAGSNYKALCPFHEEKTPSFMVSPEKQIFKCFGCGEGGSIFDFLMKYENLEFSEALKILADKAGVTLKPNKGAPKQNFTGGQKTRLFQINRLASQAFHKILTQHSAGEKARKYLKNRKLINQTIEKFQLGFAPPKRGWLEKFLRSRGFTDKEIQLAGAPGRFFNRIIFPLQDQLGNVVGFTGRSLDDQTMPKYLNTPETPIFHKSRLLYGYPQARNYIKKQYFAVLVEGQMDVILSHQAGVSNTIASSGTALTLEHLKILSRITSNLILSLDQDTAGQKAASQIIQLAQNFDFNIKLVRFPQGIKDPGELIAKKPLLWKQALKKSLYYIEWLLKNELDKLSGAPSVAEKKQIFKIILPQLKIIRDPIEQSHWIKLLSQQLDTPQETIVLALEKISSSEKNESINNQSDKLTQFTPSSQDLLMAILSRYPNLKKDHQQLYNKLIKSYNKKQLAELALVLDKLYPNFKQEDFQQEAKNLIQRLQSHQQEKIKQKFAQEIAQAEKQGNRKKVKQLLKQLQNKL